MKLSAYLRDGKVPMTHFAAEIGCDPGTMSRIVSGQQIPRRSLMERIFQATGGAVEPNDFYDLSPSSTGADDPEHPVPPHSRKQLAACHE